MNDARSDLGSDPGSDPTPRTDWQLAGHRAFVDVLAARRMCRDFSDLPVAEDMLERVSASAFRGPSAGNTASLELLVLTGSDVDRYWSVTLTADRRASFPWPGLLLAPALILPYVSPDLYVERYGEPDKVHSGLGTDVDAWAVPYWWVDGGAAVMSMLLSAEAEGLGALFFGQFAHEAAIRTEFGVPERLRPVGTVALGHRAERERSRSGSSRRKRRSIEQLVHRNAW